MTGDLSASLLKLKNSSAKLNHLTDQANETVRVVEKFLRVECNAGTPTGVPITGISISGHVENLAYMKHSGKFRIVIAMQDVQHQVFKDVNPWPNCSQDKKLRAIQRLPDLIDKIQTDLDEKVLGAQKAIEQLHKALPTYSDKEG